MLIGLFVCAVYWFEQVFIGFHRFICLPLFVGLLMYRVSTEVTFGRGTLFVPLGAL